MKSQVSPALAIAVIVLVLVVAGALIWLRTGARKHASADTEAAAKARVMGGASAPGMPQNWRQGAPGGMGRP